MSWTELTALIPADIENKTKEEQKCEREIAKFVEADLNSKGGIGGLPVKFAFRPSIQPLDLIERANEQLKFIDETNCAITVSMSLPDDDEILERIELSDALVFTQTSTLQKQPRNVFYNNTASMPGNQVIEKYCSLTQPNKVVRILNGHSTPREDLDNILSEQIKIPIDTISLDAEKDYYGKYEDSELDDLLSSASLNENDLVVLNLFGETTGLLAKVLNRRGLQNILSLNTWNWNLEPGLSLVQCGEESFPNFAFFGLCRKIDFPYDYKWHPLFEYCTPLYLAQYACRNTNISSSKTKKELTAAIARQLNMLNGKSDAFVGLTRSLAYENQKNILAPSRFYKAVCDPRTNETIWTYLDHQLDQDQWKPVVFAYIDILRVIEIDESSKVWTAEFEVEIRSPDINPIEHIRFVNRSGTNQLWGVKVISQSSAADSTQQKVRILGSFDLEPQLELYPFDSQYLDIEFSLEPSSKGLMIQPTPPPMIDRNMIIDGWKLFDAFSGFKTTKNFDQMGATEAQKVTLSQNPIISWGYKRQGAQAILRSLIPLVFLFFISWHTTFLPIDEISGAISLNTTVFLASIALYFSANKPKTGTLTLIDKVFSFFYFQVGINSLIQISCSFAPSVHTHLSVMAQILMPLSSIVFGTWLVKKVLRNRKRIMEDRWFE